MDLALGTGGWEILPLHIRPGDAIAPLQGWRYLTAWKWYWGAGLGIILATTLYLAGVRKLHRRGDRWPVGRLLSFLFAMALMTVATMGFLGYYDNALFWVHMVQHMVLTMFVGVNIAQAAPVTLALRTLPTRPRQLLLSLLHSRLAKVLLFPPLNALAMIGYPFILYTSNLYEYTLRNDLAHDLLHTWMVWIGVAFFVPIIGVDPMPNKLPHVLRLILVFLQMPGHAFMGVTLMGAERLVAEDFYLSLDRDWGLSPMQDQYWAGAILWATGDLTMITVFGGLAVAWWRDSQREARRIDRALDREEAQAAARLARLDAATAAASEAGRRYDDQDSENAAPAATTHEDEA